jgi:hypothetical protein
MTILGVLVFTCTEFLYADPPFPDRALEFNVTDIQEVFYAEALTHIVRNIHDQRLLQRKAGTLTSRLAAFLKDPGDDKDVEAKKRAADIIVDMVDIGAARINEHVEYASQIRGELKESHTPVYWLSVQVKINFFGDYVPRGSGGPISAVLVDAVQRTIAVSRTTINDWMADYVILNTKIDSLGASRASEIREKSGISICNLF